MKKRPLRQKQGFAIILAVFLMLAFSVLGYTALNILVNKNDINVKTLASLQAFYLARAARNYCLEYYISYGSDFTKSSEFPFQAGTPVIKTFSPGQRTFTIEMCTNAPCSAPTIKTAYITFSGTVTAPGLNITRRIRQTFDGTSTTTLSNPNKLPPSLDYALVYRYNPDYSFLANSSSSANITINGYSYFNNYASFGRLYIGEHGATCEYGPTITGNVDVDKLVSYIGWTTIINGLLRSRGDIPLLGGCPPQITCSPAPPPNCWQGNVTDLPSAPSMPPITTTYYDNELTRAQTNPNFAVGTPSYDYPLISGDLGGKNYYRLGNLSIGTITAGSPANIVATGNIKIDSGVSVQGRITLISGAAITINSGIPSTSGVTIGGTWSGNNCTGGAGVILYAKNTDDIDVSIRADGTSSSWVRIKGALLTPTSATQKFRSVNFTEFVSLAGIIYGKSIGGQPIGTPVNYNFGTVNGSVVIDGPFNDGVYPPGNYSSLNKAHITYTQNMIPLSIKGLYNISGSTWSYPVS